MAKGLTNAELRAEIRRMKAQIRSSKSHERLEGQLHAVRRKRVKQSFHGLVGKYIRAGQDFKAAVRSAQKAYRKL